VTYSLGFTDFGDFADLSIVEPNYQYWTTPITNMTLKKIREFENLENGWCYGEGEEIKEDLFSQAESLVNLLTNEGFFNTDAFPGPNGEIMVSVYEGKFYIQFIIEKNKSFNILLENEGKKVTREKNQTYENVKDIISKIRRELWSSLDGYTISTTTGNENDLPNSRSEYKEVVSPSLMEAA